MKRTTLSLLFFCFGMIFSPDVFAFNPLPRSLPFVYGGKTFTDSYSYFVGGYTFNFYLTGEGASKSTFREYGASPGQYILLRTTGTGGTFAYLKETFLNGNIISTSSSNVSNYSVYTYKSFNIINDCASQTAFSQDLYNSDGSSVVFKANWSGGGFICSSWTYSDWGPCQPGNVQTRTVLTSSPSGCSGGSPVLSQSCEYIAPPRYPVSYTPENPDGWSCGVQSFGSLNYNGRPHMGEDWNKSGDRGQQLYSIANGVVTDITDGYGPSDGWGKTILIRHEAPPGYYFLTGKGEKLSLIYSLYAHMLKPGQADYVAAKDIQYVEGQSIAIGESVGQVGDGDGEYSVHLHFGILTDPEWIGTLYRSNDAYGWNLIGHYTDPSELINNGYYSDASTKFSIIVHPYECTGTFQLDGVTPSCEGSSSVMGNWTRRGNGYSDYFQLGYSGIIYSKATDSNGTASWHPNLPKDGQYKISVYIPRNDTNHPYYATSSNAIYIVSHNGWTYASQSIDQSAVTDANRWVNIGIYDLLQYGNPTVELQGDTGETGKSIAVDAVKFEYMGPLEP